MNPDYSNRYYKSTKYGLSRKRQVIEQTLAELHAMQMEMVEDAVLARESVGFPEANRVINYIRAL